jgi:hypothetical protein
VSSTPVIMGNPRLWQALEAREVLVRQDGPD